MRFSLCLILLVSTFALTVTCTDATGVGSPSDSKKMEVKKALTRLRRMHRGDSEERNGGPANNYLTHSSPLTAAQSSQILHAVENARTLPEAIKTVVTVLGVSIIGGVVIGTAIYKWLQSFDGPLYGSK